jgi:hypothetical protein
MFFCASGAVVAIVSLGLPAGLSPVAPGTRVLDLSIDGLGAVTA